MKKFATLFFLIGLICLIIGSFFVHLPVTELDTKPERQTKTVETTTTTETFTLHREFPQETETTTRRIEINQRSVPHEIFRKNTMQPVSKRDIELKIEQSPSQHVNVISQKQNEIQATNKIQPKTPLAQNVEMCKPYGETMKSEFLGLDLDYRMKILGWQNDKCVIEFKADIRGFGKSFQEIYGMEAKDADVSAFAPHIRCEFSKQQISYVGDNILQEQERTHDITSRMLKNPNEVRLPQFSEMKSSDARLMEVLMNDNACEIINNGNFDKMVKDLLN